MWYNEGNDEISERTQYEEDPVYLSRQYLSQPHGRVRDEGLGKKAGLASQFHIESAATSREEIGNTVYPPARRKLAEHGISCEGHAARRLTNQHLSNFKSRTLENTGIFSVFRGLGLALFPYFFFPHGRK